MKRVTPRRTSWHRPISGGAIAHDETCRVSRLALAGKVALVTGATGGIGDATARELAKHGAAVAVHYHAHPDTASAMVDAILQTGGRAIAVGADVSDPEQARRMVQQTIDQLGKVDVLVNNAGIEHTGQPFFDKTEEEWDRIMGVDLKGAFFCTQAAAREMATRGEGGTIINVSSVHEDLPMPGNAIYTAAKGGLRMLCRTLALELAPYHINVVNVGPGAIATPINRETLEDPEKTAALLREIPLGRIGTAEEVAELIVYLASGAASYITGTTVFIDGGLMRQTGSL